MISKTNHLSGSIPDQALPGLQRRTVVKGALAGTVTLAAWWLAPPSATAAPMASAIAVGTERLVIRPRKGLRPVNARDASSVRMPIELGALISVRRGSIAAGSTMTLEWDARLYTVAQTIALLGGDETVVAEAAWPTIDKATHRASMSIVVPESLAAGRDYSLVAGTLTPGRYPDDLVTDPVPFTVRVSEPGARDAAVTVLSRPASRTTAPWGVKLGAAWQQAGWDEKYAALYPSLVTALAVGPGQIPAGSRIRIMLDPQVFTSVSAVGAFNSSGQMVPGRARTSSQSGKPTATWTATAPIAAGERISVRLNATARPLIGGLAWLEPPLVQFVAPRRSNDAQRVTGQESLTRADSIYSQATLEEFGTL